MNTSNRSRPGFLPRFPRIQRMLKRREVDKIVTFADSDFMIQVRPHRARRPAKFGH